MNWIQEKDRANGMTESKEQNRNEILKSRDSLGQFIK